MSLAELIVNCCNETIITIESEMYGMSARSNETLAVLNTEQAAQLFTSLLINHMNETYVLLIKKTDSIISEKFEVMCTVCDHSIICLLQRILTTIKFIYISLNMCIFNTKTYDTYMTGIKKRLFDCRSIFIAALEAFNEFESRNSHRCEFIDIS